MPNCEICNEYVQRRKKYVVEEDSDEFLNFQSMVCKECYDELCVNNDDPELQQLCYDIKYFLFNTEKENSRRKKTKKSPFKTFKRSVKKYVPKIGRTIKKSLLGISNFISSLDPNTLSALAALTGDPNVQNYITPENIGLIQNLNYGIRNRDSSLINSNLQQLSQQFQTL
jgi:hypothetical protein